MTIHTTNRVAATPGSRLTHREGAEKLMQVLELARNRVGPYRGFNDYMWVADRLVDIPQRGPSIYLGGTVVNPNQGEQYQDAFAKMLKQEPLDVRRKAAAYLLAEATAGWTDDAERGTKLAARVANITQESVKSAGGRLRLAFDPVAGAITRDALAHYRGRPEEGAQAMQTVIAAKSPKLAEMVLGVFAPIDPMYTSHGELPLPVLDQYLSQLDQLKSQQLAAHEPILRRMGKKHQEGYAPEPDRQLYQVVHHARALLKKLDPAT